ncbi:MAG: PilZ domain-containing protein [Candidatus Omnitrophica bacterium]|nr:PilZ domain-containing protein [Candidatus Omnitrophota bacterium]
MGSDQRYFPRWNVNNRVVYRSEIAPDHQFRHGHTKDLSCAGACLYLKEFIPPQQRITLNINLSPKTAIDVRATVVWQKAGKMSYLTGIAFHDISEADQGQILEHAFEFDRSKLLEHWYKGWDGKA